MKAKLFFLSLVAAALGFIVWEALAEDRSGATIRYRNGSILKFDTQSSIRSEDTDWLLNYTDLKALDLLSLHTSTTLGSSNLFLFMGNNGLFATKAIVSSNIVGAVAAVSGTLTNDTTGSAAYVTTSPLTNSVAGLTLVTNEVIQILSTNGDGTVSAVKTNTIISGIIGGGYANIATNATYVTTSPLTNDISGNADTATLASYVAGDLTNNSATATLARYVSGDLTNNAATATVASYVAGDLTNNAATATSAVNATNLLDSAAFTGDLTVLTNGANVAIYHFTNGVLKAVTAE